MCCCSFFCLLPTRKDIWGAVLLFLLFLANKKEDRCSLVLIFFLSTVSLRRGEV
jgi:hypothetical protein